MNKEIFFYVFLHIIILPLFSQDQGRSYSLDELLVLATSNAPELKALNSQLKENKFQIALLNERLKPQLLALATFPNLSRSIESRPLPDGRDAFVNRSTMYNSLGLRMNYQLASTGGTFYAQSNLERLDILKTEQLSYSRNYFYTPISVGINQPLFQFNETRWQKKRNDLLNSELTAKLFFIREEVIQSALIKYAQAFEAQLQVQLTARRVIEMDSLLQIKQRLFAIGKTLKVDLLRLDLELANSQQSWEQSQLEWEKSKMELCDYLGLAYGKLDSLQPPPLLENVVIDPDKALDLARANVYLNAQAERRLKEAETEIEIAEKDRGILFDVKASIGLNNSTNNLAKLLNGIEDQQNISLGLTLPITAGKSRRLRREIAQEQMFREQADIQLQQIELLRNLTIDIRSYTLLKKNIGLNKKTMEVAGEILALTSKQYLIGNQSITDLNIVRSQRDQALLRYYQSILEATLKYYQIRKSCLHDFRNNQSLILNEQK